MTSNPKPNQTRSILLSGWCPTCGDTFLVNGGRCSSCGNRAIPATTTEAHDLHMGRIPLSKEARAAMRTISSIPKESPVTTTSSPEPAIVNGYTPAVADPLPASPAKVRLPNLSGVRKLYEQIVGFEDRLKNERAKLVLRIEADNRQLQDLDRAIAAFHQLPEQIELEPEPESTNGDVWHKDYPNGCKDCGRTDRPYSARGYCKTCYPHHAPSTNGR